jgi:hypothetical protein
MQAVQRQPACTRVQRKACMRVHMTVTSTGRVYPPRMMKKKMERSIDPPLPCCVGSMYVQWREREHEASNELFAADPNAVAMLMQCGLLKLFLCLFMHE